MVGALVSITCCCFQGQKVDVSYIFFPSASVNIVVPKHPTMDVTFVKVCYSQSEQKPQSSAPDQSKQSDISLDVYSPRRSGSAPDPAAA